VHKLSFTEIIPVNYQSILSVPLL